MDRRSFLTIGGRAAAGATLLSVAPGRGRAALRQPPSVIVIGAGLSGLTAAYELDRAGLGVTVLEADSRPGGRVRTLRAGFSDGLYAEAGGQTLFPIEEDYAAPYLEEFGLSRTPPGPGGLAEVFWIRGQRIIRPNGEDIVWPLGLSERERSLGLAGLRREYLAPITSSLEGASDAWDWEQLRDLDQMSFAAWLRERGASPAAIELVNLARTDFTALPADRHSALAVAIGRESFRRLVGRPYSIEGGNDRLVRAFADRLRDRIRYGVRVTAIEASQNRVRVVFTRLGEEFAVEAPRVVCAIPPWALAKIRFSPGLSDSRSSTLASIPVANTCRFYIQTAARPWREAGLSGSATTDREVAYLWESSPWLQGPRGILHGWIGHERSAEFESMTGVEREQLAVRTAEAVFPGVRQHVEGVETWCWGADPVVPGHTALYPPGTFVSAATNLHRPAGRLHFAGTETAPSLVNGWLLGAIAAGRRVSREVIEAER